MTTHRIEMAPAPVNETADDADDQAPTGPEPTWQPLSMLPTVLAVIADELESAEELHASLVAARDRPHLLDDETIHRTQRLCKSQQELVPTYREQLGRWRKASPSLSQREALKRLASHIARYERVVRESLSLAQEMAAGTIDTILGLDDGELGKAVFEGRMKPADHAPLNEAMRVREQRAIAVVLDARINDLEQVGIRDFDLFAQMGPRNRSRAQVHLTLSVLDSEARFVYRRDHASDHGHDARPTLFARCRFDSTAAVGAPRLGT